MDIAVRAEKMRLQTKRHPLLDEYGSVGPRKREFEALARRRSHVTSIHNCNHHKKYLNKIDNTLHLSFAILIIIVPETLLDLTKYLVYRSVLKSCP